MLDEEFLKPLGLTKYRLAKDIRGIGNGGDWTGHRPQSRLRSAVAGLRMTVEVRLLPRGWSATEATDQTPGNPEDTRG